MVCEDSGWVQVAIKRLVVGEENTEEEVLLEICLLEALRGTSHVVELHGWYHSPGEYNLVGAHYTHTHTLQKSQCLCWLEYSVLWAHACVCVRACVGS